MPAKPIQIENIRKTFPGVVALDDVSIEVMEGEFFTLLGPSGCGKTTLLRTIAGFYQQDAGHIRVGDAVIDKVPAHSRDIGMVFQNYAVFPHMTVAENVAFGLKNRKIPQKEIEPKVTRALATVQLSGYEERTPDKLSGGQQQRVGLARAMVIEPRLLLLDEPLSNLDAKLRIQMREDILDIQRQLGITAVYVTHDQEEALVISDRIAVMNFGVVQQIGTPWDIYRDPANEFVATFVGNMNIYSSEVMSNSVTEDTRSRMNIPQDRAQGDVRVAFRPEDARILPPEEKVSPEDVAFNGNVEKTLFLGSDVIYRIGIGDGVTLTVNEYVSKRSQLRTEGDAITAVVPRSHLMFFDTSDGARIREEA
jgi:iron(III) transport system ATP-binding protein